VVCDVGVAVFSGEFGGVVFQGGGAERDGVAAAAAHQVVVVAGCRAKPVEGLAVFAALCFGDVLVGELVQDPVHRGQPNVGRRVLGELMVELLGAAKSGAVPERV
jgi:hypothetical protein